MIEIRSVIPVHGREADDYYAHLTITETIESTINGNSDSNGDIYNNSIHHMVAC